MPLILIPRIILAISVEVTHPRWEYNRPAGTQNNNNCFPLPILTNSNPPSFIEVKFETSDPDFNYLVQLIVMGQITYESGPHTSSSQNVTHSLPFHSFCYNVQTEIKVTVSKNGQSSYHSRYVIVYSSQYSSIYCPGNSNIPKSSFLNKQIVLIQTTGVSLRNDCCNPFANQNANAKRYRIDITESGNFQNKVVVIDQSNTYGTKSELPITGCRWGVVFSKTNNQVIFRTFIYEITLNSGYTFWWPCAPSDAAIAYHVYDSPPPIPPVIDRITQSPGVIHPQTSGRMITTLERGSPNGLHFNWTSFNRPPFMNDNASSSNSDHVIIENNYNGGYTYFAPSYHFNCKAINNYGWDERISPDVVYSTNGGGCPFVYVLNQDSVYVQDNNILHRSEFTEYQGIDIIDNYKLNITPGLFNNTINLKIIELDNDYSYLDKISLFAVDHPENTKIGITESGDIIYYYTSEVASSNNALFNTDSNVTKLIYYGTPNDSLSGEIGNTITLGAINGNNGSGDSLAIIISASCDRIRIPPIYKTYAGEISFFINGSINPIIKTFSRRENISEIIIPFTSAGARLDSAIITWNRDFIIDYISIVNISYNGFYISELQLWDAFHPQVLDSYIKLLDIDQDYMELDSVYQLELYYGGIAAVRDGFERAYVLRTVGRYDKNYESNNHINMYSNNLQNSLFSNKLHLNYPNPFNPNTNIKYEINKASFVRLIVYNILGQEIKRLVNEFQKPGIYEVVFDGTGLASGIYIYKLETQYFSALNKMLLIK